MLSSTLDLLIQISDLSGTAVSGFQNFLLLTYAPDQKLC